MKIKINLYFSRLFIEIRPNKNIKANTETSSGHPYNAYLRHFFFLKGNYFDKGVLLINNVFTKYLDLYPRNSNNKN